MRDDAEVAAAAAATGPEEVGVLGRAAGAVAAVGGDDPERDDVVGGRADFREARPTPPPSASPPIPTVAQEPPGIARPRLASAASMSISRAPAPIVATPDGLTLIERSRARSTTSPLVVE